MSNRVNNVIILGIPFSEIKDTISSALEKLGKDSEVYSFIKDNGWRCGDESFFGPAIARWSDYSDPLDVKPDTIAYVERTFRDDFKRLLKVDLIGRLNLFGITFEDKKV